MFLLALVLVSLLLSQPVSAAQAAPGGCSFGGFGGPPGGAPLSTDPTIVGVISGLKSPGAPAVDAVTGRIFILEQMAERVAVVDGNAAPGALRVQLRVKVGVLPFSVAVDGSNGRVFVINAANCQLSMIDGRAATPAVIGSALMTGSPYVVAVDESTGHVFVSLVATNQVLVYDEGLSLLATLATGISPVAFAVDPGRRLVLMATTGGQLTGTDPGAITVIDDSTSVPTLLSGGLAAEWPHDVGIDPETGLGFAMETRAGTISTFSYGADGTVSRVASTAADPGGAASSALALAVVPGGREVIVPIGGAKRVNVFAIAADGSLSLLRSINGVDSSLAPAVDSVTGNVFIAETSNGRVDMLAIPAAPGATGSPSPSPAPPTPIASVEISPSPASSTPAVVASASPPIAASPLPVLSSPPGTSVPAATSAPPVGAGGTGTGSTGGTGGTGSNPPSIDFVLPGPFDISLAPVDVARSIGITALVMPLIGAPTPIFNSTLSAHRALIGRWLRRKRPRRKAAAGTQPTLGSRLAALSTTWQGLVIYLGVTALLYCLLDARFPFEAPVEVLVATLAGILLGTALSQIPGELYVRRHYHEHGHVRVALWTLILAAACVLITRITSVQPGYVYGIVGGFAFTVSLTAADEGRMAFRGMAVLLVVGIVAWFLRIPFEPAPGTGADTASLPNTVLARVFISAVEGMAIGLIPLRFLEGESLSRWSRVRWAVLWGIGLFLFAHVILYPVSSFEPNPSAVGIWTIVATVAIYGAIAIGFWWFFRRRDARKLRYRKKAQLAEGVTATAG